MKASSRTKALLAVASAGLVVLGAASLGKCTGKPSIDDATATSANEPPVPAPEGLLADLFVGTPNASWARLQRGVGGAVGIFPVTAGGILCAAAGLDPAIASEVDGVAPAFGAIAGDPASPGYVFALKLNDLRKARGVLVDGDTARFGSREANGITELVPKAPASGPAVAVGISPNGYLLIARRSEDLAKLAPYATRTLPKRPLPADGAIVLDMPHAALGTLVRPKLDDLWRVAKAFLLASDDRVRHEHGGRAPDFGDPKAIVAAIDGWVGKRIAVVGDLEKMRLAIDFGDEGVSIVSTMTPAAGDGPAAKWVAAMTVGDSVPVASMPATSAVALSMRDSAEDRADQARELQRAVTSALGARLAEGDAKKMNDVVDDWTKARSDVLTGALAWDEPQGLSVRVPVRDGEAASRAVRGALELVRIAPFKELFRAREVTTSSEELAGLGKVSLATIAREPARSHDGRDARLRGAGDGGAGPGRLRGDDRAAGAPSSADGGVTAGGDGGAASPGGKRVKKDELALAWLVEGGVLTAATGDAPLATLGGAARPDRKLGDEPSIARTFAALAATANSVLVVQPLRFDPSRANLPVAPLVIALGRRDKDAYVRIDVAHGVLREVARWQLGL